LLSKVSIEAIVSKKKEVGFLLISDLPKSLQRRDFANYLLSL
jgi:hypothetical protein